MVVNWVATTVAQSVELMVVDWVESKGDYLAAKWVARKAESMAVSKVASLVGKKAEQ